MNKIDVDAYFTLGVAYNASEEEIRKTYHEKVKEGNASEKVIEAYERIRDERGRKRYLWNSIHSYLEKAPSCEGQPFDFENLAR